MGQSQYGSQHWLQGNFTDLMRFVNNEKLKLRRFVAIATRKEEERMRRATLAAIVYIPLAFALPLAAAWFLGGEGRSTAENALIVASVSIFAFSYSSFVYLLAKLRVNEAQIAAVELYRILQITGTWEEAESDDIWGVIRDDW